jgi:DNA-binding MarR family transcriptional regulator
LHRTIGARLGGLGITVIQYRLLLALATGGKRYHRHLAKDLGLRRQSVFAASQALTARGLIERTAQVDDDRMVMLSITREGRELLPVLDSSLTGLERYLTAGLSPNQVAGLAQAVERMGDSLVVRPMFEVSWRD